MIRGILIRWTLNARDGSDEDGSRLSADRKRLALDCVRKVGKRRHQNHVRVLYSNHIWPEQCVSTKCP